MKHKIVPNKLYNINILLGRMYLVSQIHLILQKVYAINNIINVFKIIPIGKAEKYKLNIL